jgi:hypothetical protein
VTRFGRCLAMVPRKSMEHVMLPRAIRLAHECAIECRRCAPHRGNARAQGYNLHVERRRPDTAWIVVGPRD